MKKTALPRPHFLWALLALSVGLWACSLPVQFAPQAATPAGNPPADSAAQQATQVALSVQATLTAQQNAPGGATPVPTAAAAATVAPPPPAATSTPSLPDFETWMRSANILVYEDMVAAGDVRRYIPDALNGLGLNYVDTKDALGNFKSQLLAGAPGGQPWDLIISAKEMRDALSGEFYQYMNDALADGSAVIIEEWNADGIINGKLALIFSRCGIEFDQDWRRPSLDAQVLYPIHGEHPIHHTPNEGIQLTNPTGYWTDELGDLIRLRPGSEAQLLWGTRPNVTDSAAVAAVCVDGRLIIQTYSTHGYGYDRVVPMWENYIYNALRARYEYLLAHPQG